jgi:hypothetical protein
MSTVQIVRARPLAEQIGRALIFPSSVGFSRTSELINEKLKAFTDPTPTFAGKPPARSRSIQEQLYDALAEFKIRTATVAMHLDRDWRTRVFQQLDSLLAVQDWEIDDPPPSLASFSTFLRMLILLRPERRPGLGASADGNLIATWTSGDDRLTIECQKRDETRWHLAVTIDGERERVAGINPLSRLVDVLAPFGPERWFGHGNHLPAG